MQFSRAAGRRTGRSRRLFNADAGGVDTVAVIVIARGGIRLGRRAAVVVITRLCRRIDTTSHHSGAKPDPTIHGFTARR